MWNMDKMTEEILPCCNNSPHCWISNKLGGIYMENVRDVENKRIEL